jgi:uncharacterized lipoprotein YmbA
MEYKRMNRIVQFGMIVAMGYVHAVACATSTCAGETLILTIGIPANSTATIHVPALDVKQVTVNGKAAREAQHVKVLQTEDRQVLLQAESGNYVILSKE